MNQLPSPSDIFLRRRRRRSRGSPLAWGLACAVAAQTWIDAVRLGWLGQSPWWALVPGALGFVLVGLGCHRLARLRLGQVARECDARWQLKARMESAAELAGDDSAVAVAQRADTATQLETRRPAGTLCWVGGMAAAAAACGLLAYEARSLAERSRIATARLEVAPTTPSSSRPDVAAPPIPAAPPPPLETAIVWKSPATAIAAKPAETIPLLALVRSNYGFRSITLKIAVNGRTVASYPVPAGAGTSLPPGSSDLKTQLYLDETGAKSHDVVSYFLEAQANLPPKFPIVLSPIQSVNLVATVATTPPSAAVKPPQGSLLPALPPRSRTPAGRLETLLRREESLNGEVQDLPPGTPKAATLAAQQAAIARALQALAAEHALIAPVQSLLADASIATTESTRQLELNDAAAARLPTAQAVSSLQQAVTIQDHQGRSAASALVGQVRQEITTADPSPSGAAKDAQHAQSQNELMSEAVRQQQQGSEAAATQLAQLAAAIGSPSGRQSSGSPSASSGSPSGSSGSPSGNPSASGASSSGAGGGTGNRAGRSAAELAAATEAGLAPGEALARTIRQLRDAANGLLRAPTDAGQSGSLNLYQSSAQEAGYLGSYFALGYLNKFYAGSPRSISPQAPDGHLAGAAHETLTAAELEALAGQARALANALEKAQAGARRDEWMQSFNPDDVDPAYRQSVQHYFELLSREGSNP